MIFSIYPIHHICLSSRLYYILRIQHIQVVPDDDRGDLSGGIPIVVFGGALLELHLDGGVAGLRHQTIDLVVEHLREQKLLVLDVAATDRALSLTQ